MLWSEPHYQRHMQPIWDLLPEDVKGVCRQQAGPRSLTPQRGHLALVAGWQDARELIPHHRFIYVEHGAGQTYGGDEKTAWQPGYSGSGGRMHNGALGYICPSSTVAARWGNAPSVAVGCPKMERWAAQPAPTSPAVVLAWHWDCLISTEARSAWAHYEPRIEEIAEHFRDQGFAVFGHAHPRWGTQLDRAFDAAGIDVLIHEDEVWETATHFVVDNSSLAYEAALLDRPVVSLNAPWYRREIEHGLRFWSHIPGRSVDDTDELLQVDLRHEHPEDQAARWAAADHAYNGGNAQDAADFIANICRSR